MGVLGLLDDEGSHLRATTVPQPVPVLQSFVSSRYPVIQKGTVAVSFRSFGMLSIGFRNWLPKYEEGQKEGPDHDFGA